VSKPGVDSTQSTPVLALALTCQDGTIIQAERREPNPPAHAELIVGGATGVPQRFYRRFAEFAVAQGYAVTTLDFRGIGKSAPSTLRGYQASYSEWATQDLFSTVNWVAGQSNDKPIYFVGHSFGGHALGQLTNHALITRAYFFGTGAGWSGHMPPLERLKVNFLWHALGPLVVPLVGYMPGRFIGGENLPIGVYRQWKRWCGFKRYVFDDPCATAIAAAYGNVTMPIVAANATDDLWALPVSRDYFMQGYTNAVITRRDLNPQELGMPIGHMGYFRQGREALWAQCLQFFST
jgi:predicted alpha/beta hydrolase